MAKKLKNIFKIENYTTSQFFLLILLIILIIPPLASYFPLMFDFYDFSNTGGIGDTIGGITAPFINGLAAILVFLAFKAQIKANEIFKNQEEERTILDQIKMIQQSEFKTDDFIFLTNNILEFATPLDDLYLDKVNRIIYFTTEISLTYKLIEKYGGDKDFMYKKLYYLYVINYQNLVLKLDSGLFDLLNNNGVHIKNRKYVVDLNHQFKFLSESLSFPNKFAEISLKWKAAKDKLIKEQTKND
ncbi:hypothetical protein D1818_02220 [Aquimarina sp. BL5]|uniref:hypothetical protein n=1 Tax=Aquimarina sp. BL5 TaxID=1714860 RepID=UPI000E527882|nr:hypothetical protein [Aquimarina sp. BL5]AXT49692.1 hypothetical protein D1818_02220 [Aquimarina sp. BL5]RKM96801.1 hypothetical protein D7036_20850 [Aquimarina sp. BL5]